MEKEPLVVGQNATEFGCAVQLQDISFKELESKLKALKDDYEHQRKHYFPFFQEEPSVIIFTPPLNPVNMDGERVYTKQETSFGWYLLVPNEHVIDVPESYKVKMEHLELGKNDAR